MTNQHPPADPIGAAVAALTAAYQGGAGSDFGEIACQVITSVAATAGGVETLLAGRPGSWEADYVRQIVLSTTGDQLEELWRWRTEPLVLYLDVAATFDDLGIEDLYDENLDAAVDAEIAADDAGDPDAAAAASELIERIEQLIIADRAAYHRAYTNTVRQILVERGATIDVQVIRTPDYQDLAPQPTDTGAPAWDPLREGLQNAARQRAPLPQSGAAPDWTTGTPADALRRTGRTYTTRARQAHR
jgi:hypothetical protein